ncbi:MAG: hypothetical protein AABW51_02475 [Nanoarchaeota archaeon]
MKKGLIISGIMLVLIVVSFLVFNSTFKKGEKINPVTSATQNEINKIFQGPSTLHLKIQNFAFSPLTITIKKGDSIN